MTDPKPKDAIAAVEYVLDTAEEIAASPVPEDTVPPPADPEFGAMFAGAADDVEHAGEEPAGDDGPAPPKKRKRNKFGLPEGCPVTPLGICGDQYFYLDEKRQLRVVDARGHHRLGLASLFGEQISKLYDFWPRKNDEGAVTGWRPEKCAEELMRAAARRGVWSAFERERGLGAWCGDDGELVLHCGNKIWVGPVPGKKGAGTWCDPGLIGRYVYPADAEAPRFDTVGVAAGEGGPADELLTLLKTWKWRRPDIDPWLLLGWIGAAMIGGALKWRPLIWLTGGAGTGKSTLHTVITRILDKSLIAVSDASAAGIWQKLGHRSLPVAFDELEAEEDNRKSMAVIKLARQASSGGVVLRGGADHQGAEFLARSPFLFSSILIPPLMSADRSRLAILELGKIGGDGAAAPTLELAHMRALGLQLRRRLVDGWPRLEATLELYRAALGKRGHNPRGADQFGTLLAVADLMLYDELPDTDSVEAACDKLKASDLSEIGDNSTDEELCAAKVLTTSIDPYQRGGRRTLAEWVHDAAGIPLPGSDDQLPNVKEANRVLGTFGLRVAHSQGTDYLYVANNHAGLAQLYQGTQWAGRAGTLGGWVQSWRRFPGAAVEPGTVYFAGGYSRATRVPLLSVMPDIGRGVRSPRLPGVVAGGNVGELGDGFRAP